MDFKLWKNASPDNAINKSLSGGRTINIFLKKDVDVSSPEIILKTVSGIDFGAFNYAEIPAIGRKYFIRSIDRLNNAVFRFNLECDVIETYKDEILNSNCLYKRAIKTGDMGEYNVAKSANTKTTKIASSEALLVEKQLIISVLEG